MRTCSNCGSEIGFDDVFCSNCGTEHAPLENRVSPEHGSRPAAADGFTESATAAVGPRPEAATHHVEAYDAQPKSARDVAGTASVPREQAKPPTLISASTPAGETLEHRYQRQTRNATVFIAVIVGIATVIVLVGVIWSATTISKLNSQLNGSNDLFNNSNCESQGGTNPDC
jgi:cobalamin biosynthesis Mg chelatase CobN